MILLLFLLFLLSFFVTLTIIITRYIYSDIKYRYIICAKVILMEISRGIPQAAKERNRVPTNPSQKDSFSLSSSDQEKFVSITLRTVLIGNMNGNIITTKDINENLKKAFPNQEKISPAMIEYCAYEIDRIIKKIFGFNLFIGDPTEKLKSSAALSASATLPIQRQMTSAGKIRVNDYWILVNSISRSTLSKYTGDSSDDEKKSSGILMVTLSILMFAKDRKIGHKRLIEILKDFLSADSTSTSSSSSSTTTLDQKDLNMIETVIGVFIESGYLKKTRVEAEENRYEEGITLGVRSLVEIGKDNILLFMSEITGIELTQDDRKNFFPDMEEEAG